MVSGKINKTIGLLRKLQNLLPGAAVITIYEAFTRPHLEYGDSLYDQAYNMSFHQELESIQYKCLLGQNWRHTRHIERKALTRTRFRVIPVTTLVYKTSNIL